MDDDARLSDASQRTLLVIGNSVSMAPAPGVAPYPERLVPILNGRWHVAPLLSSGATIEEMEATILAALEKLRPARIVLQVGINECAPRPLSVREREAVGRLWPPALRRLIIRVIHRYRQDIIRMRTLHQFTPLPKFIEAVRRVLAAAARSGSTVLILPITTVTTAAESRTPFTNREVARYNEALASLSTDGARFVAQHELFGTASADELCVTPDSVHLCAGAHQRLAEFIAAWVCR